MQQVTTTIDIHRPVEDVFAFLTDLDKARLWTVGLVEIRHNGPLRAGARGVDVRTMRGKQVGMPWEVTRYEPRRAVTFAYGEPFPATAAFTFDPTPEGTRLTCDTTLQLKGLYRLLGPLLAREARKTDTQQFRKAKDLLESARQAKS